MRIENEAEAVAALEDAVLIRTPAHDLPFGGDIKADLWLAYLVRQGVLIDWEMVDGVRLFTAGVMTPHGLDYGDDLESPGFASPLVCAARAYLSVNGGDDERR